MGLISLSCKASGVNLLCESIGMYGAKDGPNVASRKGDCLPKEMCNRETAASVIPKD